MKIPNIPTIASAVLPRYQVGAYTPHLYVFGIALSRLRQLALLLLLTLPDEVRDDADGVLAGHGGDQGIKQMEAAGYGRVL